VSLEKVVGAMTLQVFHCVVRGLRTDLEATAGIVGVALPALQQDFRLWPSSPPRATLAS
jgi:hypothetical protein